jgi:DNA-binding LacI/PurR family transcriptional regulator
MNATEGFSADNLFMTRKAKKNRPVSGKGPRREFTSDIMYRDLVRRVEENELKDGDAISGENGLIKTYGISLSSVRLATKKLVDNGYLITVPKIGKYIRNPNLHRFKRILVVLHREMFGHYSSIEYFTMQYLLGVMSFASKNNWYVQIVISSVKKTGTGNAFTEDINFLGIDGAVLHNFQGDHEMRLLDPYGKKIPTVNSGTLFPIKDAHCADIDYDEAIMLATEYLIDRDHRQIAYVGESNNPHFERLQKGFLKAMGKRNIAVPAERILEVEGYQKPDFYFPEIRRRFESIPRQKLPTAIVFGSDRYLRIGLEVIKIMGLQVPQDISIVSIEDSFEIQEAEPLITTVDTSYHRLGLLAAGLLNRVMFEPEGAGPFVEKIPLAIIERQSVRDLR